jgi:hypothetical protein
MLAAQIGHNQAPSDIEIVAQRLLEQEATLSSGMKFMPVPEVIADEQESGRVTDAIKGVANLIRKVADIHKSVKEPYLECGRACDGWKKRMEGELEIVKAGFAKPLNAFLEKKAAEERARQIEAARVERERAEALAAEAAAHEKAGITDTATELMDAALDTEAMAERMEDKVYTAPPSQLTKSRSIYGATASQKLVWSGEIENISAIDLNQLRNHFGLDAIQKAINAFVRDGGRKLDGVQITQKSQLSVR